MISREQFLSNLGFTADFCNTEHCKNLLKYQYNVDIDQILNKLPCTNKTTAIEYIHTLYANIANTLKSTPWFRELPFTDKKLLEKLDLQYLLVNCYSFNIFSNQISSLKKSKQLLISGKKLSDNFTDTPLEESYFRKNTKYCLESTLFEGLYTLPPATKTTKFLNLENYNILLCHHITHCKTNPFIRRIHLGQIPLDDVTHKDFINNLKGLKTEDIYGAVITSETEKAKEREKKAKEKELRITKGRLNTCCSDLQNLYKYIAQIPACNNNFNSSPKESVYISLPNYLSYIFLSEHIFPFWSMIDNINEIPSEALRSSLDALGNHQISEIMYHIALLPDIFLQKHLVKPIFSSLQDYINKHWILTPVDSEAMIDELKENWKLNTCNDLITIATIYYPILECCFYLLLQTYCQSTKTDMNKLIEEIFKSDEFIDQNETFYTFRKKAINHLPFAPLFLSTPKHFDIANVYWSSTGEKVLTLSQYSKARHLDITKKQIDNLSYPDYFKFFISPSQEDFIRDGYF